MNQTNPPAPSIKSAEMILLRCACFQRSCLPPTGCLTHNSRAKLWSQSIVWPQRHHDVMANERDGDYFIICLSRCYGCPVGGDVVSYVGRG